MNIHATVIVCRKGEHLNDYRIACANQQPPQRGDAVPTRLGWVEIAIRLPEGPSYPEHSPSFFRCAAL